MKRLVKGLTALLTAASAAVTGLSLPFSAQESTYILTDSQVYEAYEEPEDRSAAKRHSQLRAAILTPGTDFSADDKEKAASQLSEIFDRFSRIGLNSVIVNTSADGQAFYSLDADREDDPVLLALEKAKALGLDVYTVLDLGGILSECMNSRGVIDEFISAVSRFVRRYACTGIIIDDYYIKRDTESFGEYMKNGSGIGYENWLYDTAEQYFRTAAQTVKLTDSSVSVGFMANDVWANSYKNSAGSLTDDVKQAFYDGHADTKAYLENGFADAVFVRAYGSMTSQRLPFEQVAGWWGEIAAASGKELYIVHHNENIGTDLAGWEEKAQIAEQLRIANTVPAYSGSVFNSYSSLRDDPMGTTELVAEYFGKNPVSETASDVITVHEEAEACFAVTSPEKREFTTSDTSVVFMGSKDDEVYINGVKVCDGGSGSFCCDHPLDVGENTVDIRCGSESVQYSITREITVLGSVGESIEEGKTLFIEGGTTVRITVWAYEGSDVSASLNGTKIEMSPSDGRTDEDESNFSYKRYVGIYTAPAAEDSDRDLGDIQISGSFGGYEMRIKGAHVIVSARPAETAAETAAQEELSPEPEEQASVPETEAAGTQTEEAPEEQETLPAETSAPESDEPAVITAEETAGPPAETAETPAPETQPAPDSALPVLPAVCTGENVTYVRVLKDNTIVYDAKTFDDVPSPVFSQLPAGTLDVYRSTSGNYYITESGRRLAMSACELVTEAGIGENTVYVKSAGTSNGNGYLKFRLGKRTAFNMRLVGNTYFTAWEGEYNVRDFTATHLYITFDNITGVTALPSFSQNLMFSSGKWDTVTEDGTEKIRLILELRQPGVYGGHKSRYDGNGDLIMSFPVPVNTLSGLTVVIDPGHGYGKSPDRWDPGAVGEVVEADVVLDIAKELTEQLTAKGANAVRLRTEEGFMLTKERPNYARDYGCDIYLSIHANKATGSAFGSEAYYFTSFSQPLAAAVSKRIAEYYSNNIYPDDRKADRGAKYSYYHVTLQQDFPSILIETGFVDNKYDAAALGSETHRKAIAAAIVAGIEDYIGRSSLSSAPEGYCVP